MTCVGVLTPVLGSAEAARPAPLSNVHIVELPEEKVSAAHDVLVRDARIAAIAQHGTLRVP